MISGLRSLNSPRRTVSEIIKNGTKILKSVAIAQSACKWPKVQPNICFILLCRVGCEMSLVVRKPVFGISDLVPHKLGCTTTEDS